MSTEQSLERAAVKTPAIITTPEEYRGALLRWQEQHLNILTPFANFSGLMPSHGLISSLVQINTDKLSEEIYSGLPFLKNGAVAIAKRGLRKIAEGLGISTRLEYISVNQERHYWHVKAIAKYRGLDGAWIEREGSQEWDLRDGSERLKGFTGNQISEARKHGLRNCETRAINAAIRECGCGIKQVYKKDELARPFVAVRVALRQDQNDPEVKRIVAENFVGASRALYAPQASTAATSDPWADDEPSSETKSVGRGSTSQASEPKGQTGETTPAASETAGPKAEAPPTAGAVRIVEIKTYTGTSQKTGRPWTKFGVVDSNGEEHATFSATVRDRAEQARASREWVELTTQQNGEYSNLAQIEPAGQSPTLPGLENL